MSWGFCFVFALGDGPVYSQRCLSLRANSALTLGAGARGSPAPSPITVVTQEPHSTPTLPGLPGGCHALRHPDGPRPGRAPSSSFPPLLVPQALWEAAMLVVFSTLTALRPRNKPPQSLVASTHIVTLMHPASRELGRHEHGWYPCWGLPWEAAGLGWNHPEPSKGSSARS